jgi:hypothetical protein
MFRGWNQRVAGFPIVLLLLEGLRSILHGEFPAGQTARTKNHFTLDIPSTRRARARRVNRFATAFRVSLS